jgi:TonB family protein
MLARIAGGPAAFTVDGIEIGEATVLNTREFRYATYINRVIRGIQERQRVSEAYLSRDPTFDMYPVRRWTVATQITLDSSGAVERVEIVAPSGLDFVDRELVRAIRDAAPFLNPPAGMKDPDGRIRIASGWYLDAEDLRRRVSAATGRP